MVASDRIMMTQVFYRSKEEGRRRRELTQKTSAKEELIDLGT
jgi:hypothetical protein